MLRRQITHFCSKRSASYVLPSIHTLDSLRSGNEAFHGLFSQKAVDELWFKRGQSLTDQLNKQLAENQVENVPADLSELISVTSNKPDLLHVNTSASLLHNLHFALESLTPLDSAKDWSPTHETVLALLETPSIATKCENEPKPVALREWIEDSFGSIAEFRTLLLNSAKSIKGDGTTWLVAQATYAESNMRLHMTSVERTYYNLAVMNTYNGGIVDGQMRSGQVTNLKNQEAAKEQAIKKRQQDREEIEGTLVDGESESHETQPSGGDEYTLGTVEEAEELLLFTDPKLVPLLAIDASMRCYLYDYGAFGKQKYLENVWRCIDWNIVESRAPKRFKPAIDI